MKLYYSPGACSQAPHILLHEAWASPRQREGRSQGQDGRGRRATIAQINPKGSVPALELDSGEVLTENAVILQYLGDRSGLGEVLPPLGDFRRYRVLEWVNYITTELHKSFAPLFKPDASDETKAFFTQDDRRALRLCRQGARRRAVPDGRDVDHPRRLSVRHRSAGARR